MGLPPSRAFSLLTSSKGLVGCSSLPAADRVGTTGTSTRSPLDHCTAPMSVRTGDSGCIHDRKLFPPGDRVSSFWGAQLSWVSLGGNPRRTVCSCWQHVVRVASRRLVLAASQRNSLQGSSLSTDPQPKPWFHSRASPTSLVKTSLVATVAFRL